MSLNDLNVKYIKALEHILELQTQVSEIKTLLNNSQLKSSKASVKTPTIVSDSYNGKSSSDQESVYVKRQKIEIRKSTRGSAVIPDPVISKSKLQDAKLIPWPAIVNSRHKGTYSYLKKDLRDLIENQTVMFLKKKLGNKYRRDLYILKGKAAVPVMHLMEYHEMLDQMVKDDCFSRKSK